MLQYLRQQQQRSDDGDLLEATNNSDIADDSERQTAIGAERLIKIDPALVGAIAASQCGFAPRPGLEPGTCGLTVHALSVALRQCWRGSPPLRLGIFRGTFDDL